MSAPRAIASHRGAPRWTVRPEESRERCAGLIAVSFYDHSHEIFRLRPQNEHLQAWLHSGGRQQVNRDLAHIQLHALRPEPGLRV